MYAILGQLAWGEATTYELVKAMRRNLRFMWPRAESRIYEEARRLVEAGLLTARGGATGQRPRTIYSITAQGRRALRTWHTTPPGAISLENEPLLRVFLGRQARPRELVAAIAAVRHHADSMLEIGRPLAQEYFDGVHPQQPEVHLRALTFDYLYHWALFQRDWARRAGAEVELWDDTRLDAEKEERALARLRDTLSDDRS
jgi:PadR family transcriptional regulator, regulatory protein AphA